MNMLDAIEMLATEQNKLNKLREENSLKDKRISLLTETLASRDKDITTLKEWICKLESDLLQNNCQSCILKLTKDTEQLRADNKILYSALDTKEELNEVLRKSEDKQKKVIKAMAEWISKQDLDKLICKDVTDGACGDENGRPCVECIIEWFKGEVEE